MAQRNPTNPTQDVWKDPFRGPTTQAEIRRQAEYDFRPYNPAYTDSCAKDGHKLMGHGYCRCGLVKR